MNYTLFVTSFYKSKKSVDFFIPLSQTHFWEQYLLAVAERLCDSSSFHIMERLYLDKQTAPYETIKHQRDKQIIIVYRADIQLLNLNKGY